MSWSRPKRDGSMNMPLRHERTERLRVWLQDAARCTPRPYGRVVFYRRGTLILAVVLLTTLAGVQIGNRRHAVTRTLYVESEHLDLGNVWSRTHFEHVLPLSNHTTSPLQITQFRTSCNCTSITPSSPSISPGEKCIRQKILHSGRNTGLLEIAVQPGLGQERVIPVEVTYYGLRAS